MVPLNVQILDHSAENVLTLQNRAPRYEMIDSDEHTGRKGTRSQSHC